ncbi:hypothetical protein [Fodinibius sediminis]|uniref:hypothetical protein n=1 Tax=Fodinibius sediminis TaxID=1214077 RepID=UPI001157EE3B|nr:hypothetical protein [Fodinibius sediminis]
MAYIEPCVRQSVLFSTMPAPSLGVFIWASGFEFYLLSNAQLSGFYISRQSACQGGTAIRGNTRHRGAGFGKMREAAGDEPKLWIKERAGRWLFKLIRLSFGVMGQLIFNDRAAAAYS